MKTNGLLTKLVVLLAAICLTMSLISCGGGGQNASLTTASAGAATGTRSIVITVDWPKRSAASHTTRLVPAATANILIGIANKGGTFSITTATIPQGQLKTTINQLPAGDLTATATANDANGNALATGSTDFTTQVNAVTPVTIIMQTTIDHLVVTPATPTVTVGGTLQLQASGVNTTGKSVLLTSSNLTWSSGTPAIAAVDPKSGMAAGVAAGSAVITVIDSESGKSGQVTATSSLSLDGTWSYVYTQPESWGLVITFNSDGTFIDGNGVSGETITGTYSLSGGSLNFSPSEPWSFLPAPPPVSEGGPWHVVWQNSNSIILSANGNVIHLSLHYR